MFVKDHKHNLPIVDANLTTEHLNYYNKYIIIFKLISDFMYM